MDAVDVMRLQLCNLARRLPIRKQNPALRHGSFYHISALFPRIQRETYLSGAFMTHAQRSTSYT